MVNAIALVPCCVVDRWLADTAMAGTRLFIIGGGISLLVTCELCHDPRPLEVARDVFIVRTRTGCRGHFRR